MKKLDLRMIRTSSSRRSMKSASSSASLAAPMPSPLLEASLSTFTESVLSKTSEQSDATASSAVPRDHVVQFASVHSSVAPGTERLRPPSAAPGSARKKRLSVNPKVRPLGEPPSPSPITQSSLNQSDVLASGPSLASQVPLLPQGTQPTHHHQYSSLRSSYSAEFLQTFIDHIQEHEGANGGSGTSAPAGRPPSRGFTASRKEVLPEHLRPPVTLAPHASSSCLHDNPLAATPIRPGSPESVGSHLRSASKLLVPDTAELSEDSRENLCESLIGDLMRRLAKESGIRNVSRLDRIPAVLNDALFATVSESERVKLKYDKRGAPDPVPRAKPHTERHVPFFVLMKLHMQMKLERDRERAQLRQQVAAQKRQQAELRLQIEAATAEAAQVMTQAHRTSESTLHTTYQRVAAVREADTTRFLMEEASRDLNNATAAAEEAFDELQKQSDLTATLMSECELLESQVTGLEAELTSEQARLYYLHRCLGWEQ